MQPQLQTLYNLIDAFKSPLHHFHRFTTKKKKQKQNDFLLPTKIFIKQFQVINRSHLYSQNRPSEVAASCRKSLERCNDATSVNWTNYRGNYPRSGVANVLIRRHLLSRLVIMPLLIAIIRHYVITESGLKKETDDKCRGVKFCRLLRYKNVSL